MNTTQTRMFAHNSVKPEKSCIQKYYFTDKATGF